VVKFVTENFMPARVHVRDDSALFQKYGEKYGAQWTPTILELDAEGVERRAGGGDLVQNIDAVLFLVNHPADARHLPADPVHSGLDLPP
jgi:hypothetical protein